MLLAVGHLEPVQALFPAAQAAFAITFGIGFANADAGAGNGEKIGLFHILKAFEIRDRTNQNFRLLSLSSKYDRCIQQDSYQYPIELVILNPITAMVSYRFKWGSKVYSKVSKIN